MRRRMVHKQAFYIFERMIHLHIGQCDGLFPSDNKPTSMTPALGYYRESVMWCDPGV